MKHKFAVIALAASALCAGGTAVKADPHRLTTTPIEHVVVIFGENNSFDHYFGTYPVATNPPGEPPFHALPDTPSVNGLGALTADLIAANPNYFMKMPAPPFRLDRNTDAITCDNDNGYAAEQEAYDHGLADQFPTYTSVQAGQVQTGAATASGSVNCLANGAMGYYDGNTVTALWNYAQHYAMSDNFYDTEFGVTEEGHQNLISGQTHTSGPTSGSASKDIVNGTMIANIDPPSAQDDCTKSPTVQMTSRNVGDLLNAANGGQGVTWGWFYGDFAAGNSVPAVCNANYNPHYMPFQYYASTANPHHLQPSSTAAIGTKSDQANHQYDLNALNAAIAAGNLPAVTFIKAMSTETGHPTNSGPLLEQTFLVDTINALMRSPEWPTMAIFITYDDSDGWYDHVMPPIVNESADSANDFICQGPLPAGAFNDRCGYGTRLPFIVISPYARHNYVDRAVTDTTSILAFIESNWNLGFIDPGTPAPGQASFDRLAGSIAGVFDFNRPPDRRTLILNPSTGEVVNDY